MQHIDNNKHQEFDRLEHKFVNDLINEIESNLHIYLQFVFNIENDISINENYYFTSFERKDVEITFEWQINDNVESYKMYISKFSFDLINDNKYKDFRYVISYHKNKSAFHCLETICNDFQTIYNEIQHKDTKEKYVKLFKLFNYKDKFFE